MCVSLIKLKALRSIVRKPGLYWAGLRGRILHLAQSYNYQHQGGCVTQWLAWSRPVSRETCSACMPCPKVNFSIILWIKAAFCCQLTGKIRIRWTACFQFSNRCFSSGVHARASVVLTLQPTKRKVVWYCFWTFCCQTWMFCSYWFSYQRV